MELLVFTAKIAAAYIITVAAVSIELGPEFWLAVNGVLNLLTLMYVHRTKNKVEHVENVATHVLETRTPGGRREHDPEEPAHWEAPTDGRG